MKIKLDLEKHCIETEIKRLHNRAIEQYFRSERGRHEAEERIDLLQRALETFDFPLLRTVSVVLGGNNDAEVVLSDEKGRQQPVISINGLELKLE